MGFRFVRWLLMMFIFTFSSSHCDCLWLLVIACDWFADIEWVRMNGSCLLKDENELDNLFFLSFLQWWKQTRNEILFVLFFIFADFADCYQFSQNETNRHSFWIVIWESVILIKLVEMIEISIAFAKNVLNLICFVSSFWFEDCWKGEVWKEVWNLLVRNNWWKSRKKERKVWFFAFIKLDETPSRLDWLNGWNWLQSNKQRFQLCHKMRSKKYERENLWAK